MSGIFIILWDPLKGSESPVLHTTEGGYPHITVVYTGKSMRLQVLVHTAVELFPKIAQTKVTLTRAYVNSFTTDAGVERHDVLLDLSQADMDRIDDIRTTHFKEYDAIMRRPHVTHGIFSSKEQAEKTASRLNETCFPYTVDITGIAID